MKGIFKIKLVGISGADPGILIEGVNTFKEEMRQCRGTLMQVGALSLHAYRGVSRVTSSLCKIRGGTCPPLILSSPVLSYKDD